MWSSKLGLPSADDALVKELLQLLVESSADYSMLKDTQSSILSFALVIRS